MDIYDIDKIIAEALRSKTDISPCDRLEWRMFCCALKVLGYDELTFVALSSGNPADSRKAWREEKHPQRYKSEDESKAMICALAKDAGMDIRRFLLSPNAKYHAKSHIPRKTAPTASVTPITPAAPVLDTLHITPQQITSAMSCGKYTSLYFYLCRLFGNREVDKVFAAYKVGGSKYINEQGGHASCFPYVNVDGICIDCKIFHINPNDGSRRTAPPLKRYLNKKGESEELPTTWALAEMRQSSRRDKWCNFGDHLINVRPNADICLVESEKTALMASIVYPQFIWIALGSKTNITIERCKPYLKRNVILFPDRDGIPYWSEKAKELAAEGHNIRIDTTVKRTPGEPKDDIADLIVRSLDNVGLPRECATSAPASLPAPAAPPSASPMPAPIPIYSIDPDYIPLWDGCTPTDSSLPFPMPNALEVCPF